VLGSIFEKIIRNIDSILQSHNSKFVFRILQLEQFKIGNSYTQIMQIEYSGYAGAILKRLNFSGWRKKYNK